MTDNPNSPSPGTAADFIRDIARCWNQLPNKAIFFGLLAAWLIFFQFLGNATFGYIDTTSLLRWMLNWYWNPVFSNNVDTHGNTQAASGSGLSHFFDGFSDDAYGLLIPPAVLAFLWWKRRRLLALPLQIWWPGLFLLAGAILLHFLGYLIQQPRISIVALFGGIYALMGLAWGPGWLRASFFPIILFAFCIPISSIATPVTFRLRLIVASVVSGICNTVLGVPVVREGTQLFNASHTYRYEVAAACSGLRSSIAVFALATIFGFMTFGKNWKRLVMMAAAFPLAMLGNILRMMCIIIAAELGGQPWGNFVHENFFFSLLPYLPVFVGLMALGHWLREPLPETTPSPEAKTP